ncbi:Oidioi.mRNA.OKI2018_I69.PAR.g9652.t1.cds [Oikopleura dioica]|uniref:Oidioi.mRNA.OKI2018_I69.PAR.g9652.t1.cds n=1 Tax=Oikopleura dioica TaxID=34765 RepID=A0ABN7RSD2_OIKDI|nr:Oidioi.mRNA.OKI2018_I69.PAR.g9652.t1.cds [Oikopleura dioica]
MTKDNYEAVNSGFFESSIPKFEDALKTFEKPDYYDDKLFHEGREFYRKYKGACIFSMALSVVAGHVFENVTKVMVFTKRTETSRSAFWRYWKTAERVNSWLVDDVFDSSTKGHREILNTVRIHKAVAKKINKEEAAPKSHVWVSQSDMAHVLVGFAGPIVVAPRFFGIQDENELVAYLHTWRVLGHLLGIDDQYNPFVGNLLAIQTTITKLYCFVGVPGAANPPENFHHHTDMICEWAGSKNAIMMYGLDAHDEVYRKTGIKPDKKQLKAAKKRFKLETFGDYFQYYHLMIVFQYLYTFWFVRFVINDVLYNPYSSIILAYVSIWTNELLRYFNFSSSSKSKIQ